VETRVLTVNTDPVFQDRALAILDQIEDLETQIVRNLSEAVQALLEENFDGLIIEAMLRLPLSRRQICGNIFPPLPSRVCLRAGAAQMSDRERKNRISNCW